jgi:crotonobetainyl-CoA:carnitine CoA-transferase CaiB-like acyl-CoA transferase
MLPLEGLRILAFSQVGAGPLGTMTLADLGAEVIKIEDPGTKGDIGRYVAPYAIEKDSLLFQTFNRNKICMTLNLRVPEAQEIFHDLVKISDVVFCTARGDQPEKLGWDYESLKGINPKIVCASLTGYGRTGPRAKEPGFDYILQGMAGWMDITGEPDGPPTKSGLSLVDCSAGLVAALAIMVGLHSAQKNGVGCDIDLSLYDIAVSLLNYPAVWHLNKGFKPKRVADSGHPGIVPCQNFKTKDGYVVVMCYSQKFWENLCEALDRKDLAEDERFISLTNRYENKAALMPDLKEIFLQKNSEEWLKILKTHDVPAGPVNTIEEVFKEPQLSAREMLIDVEHPVFGTLKELASPIKIKGVTQRKEPAPGLGENTDDILRTVLKYDDRKIEALKEKGAI